MWQIWGSEEYTRFWLGNLRERENLEDKGIDGIIRLKWVFKMWGMGRINQAHDRYRWKALVNVVTKLWVTYSAGSLTSWGTISFSRRILLHAVTVTKQKTDISPEDGTNRQKHAMGMNKWKNFSHMLLCTTEHIPENYNVLFWITRWPAIMIFHTCWSGSPQLIFMHAIFFRCVLVYIAVTCHRCWVVMQYTQATEDTQHWCNNITEQICVPFITETKRICWWVTRMAAR